MNIATAIHSILKGQQTAVSHLRWHLVCSGCGRDYGYCSGYPKTLMCFECERPVEYLDNEQFKG